LQGKAAPLVFDLGGIPVQRPLIQLIPCEDAVALLPEIGDYDWLVLTSPSSVRCLIKLLKEKHVDVRQLPGIMVCGSGTAAELEAAGLKSDLMPDSGFSASSISKAAKSVVKKNERILRLRSDKADSFLSDSLKEIGAVVDDRVLYRNEPVKYNTMPEFDAVFFASSSAVEYYVSLWGKDILENKTVLAIGKPTEAVLSKHDIKVDVMSEQALVDTAIYALAQYFIGQDIQEKT
jgi:uroporphyrinogen-III synthase